MLTSGNGRHRKPRQAPTAMVAVAATGAGIALPLFAAGGAQAADVSATTWNAVALCESGGLWSANSGNGFYGGLQITQQTWDEYGGQDYAKRPDLASQNEQITVADHILGSLGADAWPTCADISGLTAAVTDTASGSASTSTSTSASPTDGATGTPTDGATAPTGGATDTPTDSASGSTTDTGTGGSTKATASPDSSSTKAATPAPAATTPTRSTGRHAKPETVPATAEAAWGKLGRSTTKADSDITGPKRYRVRDGDSLCDIAVAEHVTGGWHALYEANKTVIGDDPGVIHPGQYLTVG
ncbi:LysM peptidoglycan-binding domain-containing protein [Actinacidiphila soli]|uniref:LysM peptidoglycan-binding domain-containing protein n=1 Tax=Actinacidiphila soli TaxID=2487275 RepID=UPI000FCCA8C4|nr:transglycosylase family protein [Actinacidiphila soli]